MILEEWKFAGIVVQQDLPKDLLSRLNQGYNLMEKKKYQVNFVRISASRISEESVSDILLFLERFLVDENDIFSSSYVYVLKNLERFTNLRVILALGPC